MSRVCMTNSHPCFPGEMWDLIAQKTDTPNFIALQNAFPGLRNFIKPSTHTQKLFPYVFEVLYGKSFVGFEEAKACRQVCSTWKESVDEYFQSTNFNSVLNVFGAKNQSDLIIRMPLTLVDINQIYEMDLDAGCLSFGKKLTLEMVYDERNIAVFPDHLGEVNALLRTVPRFWEQFDHLEVRRFKERVPVDRNSDHRRTTWHNNPDFLAVPFGNIFSDEEIVELICKLGKREVENFEMYIPFLHLMTNLKKVSLRLKNNDFMETQVLLRIPRTENLKEIIISSLSQYIQYPLDCRYELYKKCAKSVNFLTGATTTSLEYCIQRTGSVFENLTELHITVHSLSDEFALARKSASCITKMFPNVTILKISMDSGGMHRHPNLWDWLAKYVGKFPALKYFALSGGCMKSWCTKFKTINRHGEGETRQEQVTISSSSTGGSGLKTFRFECPIHVPVRLMRMFPGMEHVIVDEYPERCRRRNSKSSDWKYLKGFFAMFLNVSSLTFVPVTISEETGDWLWGPGCITRLRDDEKLGSEYRKRK